MIRLHLNPRLALAASLVVLVGVFASACGGLVNRQATPKGAMTQSLDQDSRAESRDEAARVEAFALEFVGKVSEGDRAWLQQHCDERSADACLEGLHEDAAYCAPLASRAVARRHPDPQGQWLVTVVFSPACNSDGDDWAEPCMLLDVESQDDVWKADIPVQVSSEEDCWNWEP